MANPIVINDIVPFNSYIARAGETNFVFDWFVLKPEYVNVYKSRVLLTYLTDYTVKPGSVQNALGGNIILNTPCLGGEEVIVLRNSIIKRTSGYTEGGDYRASAVNLDFNYIISILQEISFKLSRTVGLSPFDPDMNILNLLLPSLADRKGKYLGFDNNGKLVALPGSKTDLYYSWTELTMSQQIVNISRSIYVTLTTDITLTLPSVTIADEGRAILIMNPDTNTHKVSIKSSDTSTIDGQDTNILPGEYVTFIYIAKKNSWIMKDSMQ
jgi:hypothetical protein